MATPASPDLKRYRGAVIGAGGIARQSHLPALRGALGARVDVIALVDNATDVSPVDAIPLLSRPEQLHELAPLDFIDICTPTASHLELTLWGLEQGYHVVCEKPVALTRAEAGMIAAAARTNGRIVMPCHQYRHNPVWMKVKEWLASGAIARWHLAEFSVHRRAADSGRVAEGMPWRGTRAAGRHGWRRRRARRGGGSLPGRYRAGGGRRRARVRRRGGRRQGRGPARRVSRELQLLLFVWGSAVCAYLVARIGVEQLLADAMR